MAWGDHGSGRCDVPEPNAGFIAVAAGEDHSIGLRSGGSIAAWGNNVSGQCDVPEPNSGFTAVAAGTGLGIGLASGAAPSPTPSPTAAEAPGPTVTPTPAPPPFAIRLNFQRPDQFSPRGFVADSGSPFDPVIGRGWL